MPSVRPGLAGDGGRLRRGRHQGRPALQQPSGGGPPDQGQGQDVHLRLPLWRATPKIGEIAGGGPLKVGRSSERSPNAPQASASSSAVQSAAGRGWLKGIDGRKVPVKSAHSALNYRLASQEAVICKRWGCDWEDELLARGLKHGWDGDFRFRLLVPRRISGRRPRRPQLIETVRDTSPSKPAAPLANPTISNAQPTLTPRSARTGRRHTK
jgi:hypothetical protein